MYLSDYDRDNLDALIAGSGDWFTAQLARLYAKADFENRRRLARGFPRLAAAYEEWFHHEDTAKHDRPPANCRCTVGRDPGPWPNDTDAIPPATD